MFVGYPLLLGAQKEAGDKGASSSLNVQRQALSSLRLTVTAKIYHGIPSVATRLLAAGYCRVT